MKKDNENLTVCININNSLAKIMKIFFKLCILVFIPYTILCMTLGWGEWWYFLYPPSQKFFIPEITLILFISLGCVIYIHLFYPIVQKYYLAVPLFLTFLSGPVCIIKHFNGLILGRVKISEMPENLYNDFLHLCIYTVAGLVVTCLISILFSRFKKKTVHQPNNS